MTIEAKKKGYVHIIPKKASARIKSINPMGLMKIEFSHKMNITSLSNLNSSAIDVFISPIKDEEDQKARDVNLTWEAVKFEDKILEVQMNFSSPLDISSMK